MVFSCIAYPFPMNWVDCIGVRKLDCTIPSFSIYLPFYPQLINQLTRLVLIFSLNPNRIQFLLVSFILFLDCYIPFLIYKWIFLSNSHHQVLKQWCHKHNGHWSLLFLSLLIAQSRWDEIFLSLLLPKILKLEYLSNCK